MNSSDKEKEELSKKYTDLENQMTADNEANQQQIEELVAKNKETQDQISEITTDLDAAQKDLETRESEAEEDARKI